VGYAYVMEFFIAWYSGNTYEVYAFRFRALGDYAWAFWIMILCNVVVPQFLWFRKLRMTLPYLFVISILVNVGMWLERFVIIVASLSRDFLPSSWGYFKPTIFDIGTFVGSIGLFLTLFLLFLRFLPMVAMSEVKGALPQAKVSAHGALDSDEARK